MSVLRHFRALQFKRDERGDIAPMFGLAAIVMFITMGLAIDVSRWHHAKQMTKKATDAAVLAAGRALQLNGADVDGALEVAQKFYNLNIKSRVPVASDDITFILDQGGAVITARGNAFLKTTLLSLAGIHQLPLLDESGSDYSEARIAIGKNSDKNVELSLMLDITGSMAGQKLEDMKSAAKDLIEIVVWANQSDHTSKVALVPFSQAVNLGGTYFNAITGENTDSELAEATSPESPAGTGYAWLDAIGRFQLVTPAHARRPRDDDGEGGTTYGPCAVDRTGPEALTDAKPGPGTYLQAYDIARNNNDMTKGRPCVPSAITITPLSNNKTALKAKIDQFTAAGWTAGSVGTAYAWYMLSPEWKDIWPEGSKPAAYDNEETMKIAILMTDGEYNVWYNGDDHGNASEQAVSLCAGMKAKGITVYTVGFDLGSNETAIETLRSCATDPDHAYLANNGDELKQAFRDIALKTTDLYLSR